MQYVSYNILKKDKKNVMMEEGMSSSLTSIQDICLKIKYDSRFQKSCNICEEMFTCQQKLEVHELDHGLNALFKCNMCLKCFEKHINEESHHKISPNLCN